MLLILLLSLFSNTVPAESADSLVIINQIEVVGNQRTKKAIIERELDFYIGDSLNISQLQTQIELNRRKIMNTNLFISVEATYAIVLPQQVKIQFKVLEQWYILGYPVFQIADRNYSEWWQRGHDFKRTVYGIDIFHSNFRGRAEKINLHLENGFTKRIDFAYRIPYLDKSLKTGAGFSISYITNKNVAFESVNDTLHYYRSNTNNVRERFSTAIYLKKRYHFYDNHLIEIRFNKINITDTIAQLNPNYFLNNRTQQRFIQLSYLFNYDFRDNVSYPLKGKRYEFLISQLGIFPTDNIHQLEITADYSYYKPLRKKLFYGVNFEGKISFPDRQGFYNTRGLGYSNDLVRGYELYVVDGSAYGYVRNNLRYQLLNSVINLRFLKFKQFNKIPLALYPNFFADMGYVHNNYSQENKSKLANRILAGTGIGLDIVTYYNLVVKFSYAMNDLKQKGFIFNIGREF